MQSEFPEVAIVIITTTILLLFLVGFIIIMLILNQKSRLAQVQELRLMKEKYEQELLRTQLEIQENIFGNLSQEIHDNIGQSLTFVSLSLLTVPVENGSEAHLYIEESRKMLQKAITELRDLSKGLQTERIMEIGLVKSIEFELQRLERTNLYKTSFIFTDVRNLMDHQTEIILFRIVQEMLNNFVKHARASELEIYLTHENDIINLEIRDNGVGFDPGSLFIKENPKGLGLRNIRKRATLIGGHCNIDSIKNGGTTIRITIPVNKQPFHEHHEESQV
ncbi:sensor histidine kinase [Chitinophaga agrisoli]|uniref:Oxygen sensor histidine kinase NreB n=1 Tax=Chitinophaga agrisoli TaxID=2607653 RepID=A0A5B2VPR9_9BACT|nr:sensor histidine kinase [Chitinophaga agrisoli]KAA2240406.1 sensor histidine kinase [Chitinophaga agrisoli]